MNKLPPFTPQHARAVNVDSQPQQMPTIPEGQIFVCGVIDWEVGGGKHFLITDLSDFAQAYAQFAHWPEHEVQWCVCDAPAPEAAEMRLRAA